MREGDGFTVLLLEFAETILSKTVNLFQIMIRKCAEEDVLIKHIERMEFTLDTQSKMLVALKNSFDKNATHRNVPRSPSCISLCSSGTLDP
tara:strand:- start:1642 stop:1914 length:273 start_codon:yes stop_codon:yes gene_type:complete